MFSVLFSFQKEKLYFHKGFLVPLRLVHGQRVFSSLFLLSSGEGEIKLLQPERARFHFLLQVASCSRLRGGRAWSRAGPLPLLHEATFCEKTSDSKALNVRPGCSIRVLCWVGWWKKCLVRKGESTVCW